MQEEFIKLARQAKITIKQVQKLWNDGKKAAKLKKLKVGGPAYLKFARAYMHRMLPAAPLAPVQEVKADVKSKKPQETE